MLIKELLALREGAMKEKRTALLEAIENEFGCDEDMCERIADWLTENATDDEVEEYLIDKLGLGTYGGDGDPSEHLASKMEKMFQRFI